MMKLVSRLNLQVVVLVVYVLDAGVNPCVNNLSKHVIKSPKVVLAYKLVHNIKQSHCSGSTFSGTVINWILSS